MAQRFIVGEDAKDALPAITKLWKQGVETTVDLLGEATVSEAEADRYAERCEETLRALAAAATKPGQVNLSVKVSALTPLLRPEAPERGIEGARPRLAAPAARRARGRRAPARRHGVLRHARGDHRLTLDLLSQPEFADGPSAGIVLQAYLVESPEYLDDLLDWARETPRTHPFTIRLVKGAYWDHEVVQAAQHGWTPPVFTDRRACDRNFELLTKRLIDATPTVRVAIASHNLRSIAAAAAYADARGVGNDDLEFQILRGLGDDTQAAIAATGRRVRAYCPVGDLVAGMAYLVRRLLENTANDSFLAAHAGGTDTAELLEAPMITFANEPLLELRREAVRREALHALAALDAKLPLEVPMLIGEDVVEGRRFASVDPSNPTIVVAHAHGATAEHVRDAITARRARPAGVVQALRRRPRRRAVARRGHPALAPARAHRAGRPRGGQAVGRGRRRRLRGDRLPRVLRARRARAGGREAADPAAGRAQRDALRPARGDRRDRAVELPAGDRRRAWSPPRSPPATPWCSSPPSRRPRAPRRSSTRCTPAASRSTRCRCSPAATSRARRWSPTRASTRSSSPAPAPPA